MTSLEGAATWSQCCASTDITEGIPQGILCSPDGLCSLTSVREELRLYNTFEATDKTMAWKSALTCRAGDIVQSYHWYPAMNSNAPGTCCFVATSRQQPIHLWDAYSGGIRATYSPLHPEREEPDSPMVAKFSPNGATVLCGGFASSSDRYLLLFDVSRPGKDHLSCLRLGKTKRSRDGQKGLVSCLCFAESNPNVVAVGTYSPGSIYLYDLRTSGGATTTPVVLQGGVAVVGHGKNFSKKTVLDADSDNFLSRAKTRWFQRRLATGGITQLSFGNNDVSLLCASRQSEAVVCWDVRKMTASSLNSSSIGTLQSYFAVNHSSNQRLLFHIQNETQQLFVGDRDKVVKVYDITSGSLVEQIEMNDVVNGVSVSNSNNGNDILAVSLGERQYVVSDDDDDDEGAPSRVLTRGTVQLWKRSPSSSMDL